jgi:hypothetical protein
MTMIPVHSENLISMSGTNHVVKGYRREIPVQSLLPFTPGTVFSCLPDSLKMNCYESGNHIRGFKRTWP